MYKHIEKVFHPAVSPKYLVFDVPSDHEGWSSKIFNGIYPHDWRPCWGLIPLKMQKGL